MSKKQNKSDIKANNAASAADNIRHFSIIEKISDLGEYFFIALMTAAGFVGGILMVALKKVWLMLKKLGAFAAKGLKRFGVFIAKPFVRYFKAFSLGNTEMKTAFREKGFFKGCLEIFRVTGRILFGKRGVLVTLCNYALPVISCIFLINIISYANNMTYALKLTVNGDFFGYVTDEATFTAAEKMVQQRINYTGSTQNAVSFEAEYELEMVGQNPTLTKYQLANNLLASLDATVENGYGMYIGNSFYGALRDKEKIEQTLEELLDVYRTGAENENVQFEMPITFEPGLYLTDSMVSESSIIRLITSKKSIAAYYTAVEGDSPYGIATKLGMTMAEVARLNPGFSENTAVFVGDKFLMNQEEPFLAVTVTRTETYLEDTPYETQYVDDSTHYEGSTTVSQLGVYGSDSVTADVSYINGIEVRRKELSRHTITEPVPKIIAVGTKPIPPNSNISIQNVNGQFYWPVGSATGGKISEMVYARGGYWGHKGIDIVDYYGSPIVAADSGKVLVSRWYYDYGYCVIIQHENGLVTVYGHMSYLRVSEGQYVTQGQQIGDMGATGQATGTHLHFEIRRGGISGTKLDPIDYLPWHQRAPWCVEYY